MLIEIIRALNVIADNVAARKLTLTTARDSVAKLAASLDGLKVSPANRDQAAHIAKQMRDLCDLRRVEAFTREIRPVIAMLEAFDAKASETENPARAALMEKQRKELAALEANQAIENLLPVPPKYIVNSSIGDMCCYEVKGLRGAVELMKRFSVLVPMAQGRNGFVRVAPPEMLGDKFTIKEGEMYAACFDVEGGIGRHIDGASVAIDFWTRIEGRLLHIKIDIKGPDYIGHYNKFIPACNMTRDRSGRIISISWSPNKYASTLGRPITWSTGDKSSYHHDHLILADYWQDMQVTEFAEMFDRLEALIALVEEIPEVEIVENPEYEAHRCGEYPLFSEDNPCPNKSYSGGLTRYLCHCDNPNRCPGVNAVRKWYGKKN